MPKPRPEAVANGAVRRRFGEPINWTSEMDGRLGKASDGDISVELGCSATSVANRRRWLNIPPFVAPLLPVHVVRLRKDDFDAMGLAPDSAVAKEAGVPLGTVQRARRKREIPAFGWKGIPESAQSRAKALGLNYSVVQRRIRNGKTVEEALSKPTPLGRPRDPTLRARIAELLLAGWKIRAVARELGCDPKTVRAHDPRPKPPPVERCEPSTEVCEVPCAS